MYMLESSATSILLKLVWLQGKRDAGIRCIVCGAMGATLQLFIAISHGNVANRNSRAYHSLVSTDI